jgi:hypothetical protein
LTLAAKIGSMTVIPRQISNDRATFGAPAPILADPS